MGRGGADFELLAQRAHAGKLIACLHLPGEQRLAHRQQDLVGYGRAVSELDGKWQHGLSVLSVTAQLIHLQMIFLFSVVLSSNSCLPFA